MKKIRVLHVNAGSSNFGGVSAICLNLFRYIDRDCITFDFLTPNITTYSDYKDEIRSMGGHIYHFHTDTTTISGKIKFIQKLNAFLNQKKYDVVHVNSGVLLFNCIVAGCASKLNNTSVFVHSHNNGGRNRIKEILSPLLKEYLIRHSDCLLACSNSAAEYMFPTRVLKDVTIINNGIDSESFRFNKEIRESVRKEEGWDNKFVIGHVGRFTNQKNHEYLIDIFKYAKKIRNNAVLILIGQGELMPSIKEKAREYGLSESVFFLGQQKDMGKYYQAMDVFVLPSKMEGFGIVNLEAQSSGLKCVVSDVVPNEANVIGSMVKLSINDSPEKWAKEICDASEDRDDYSEMIKSKGFDIRQSARVLEKKYKAVCTK